MQPADRALNALKRPPLLLGALAIVQWLVVGGVALSAQRNGWLFYQGGDQTFFYSTRWLLGQGQLPRTRIGYGWSLVTAPARMLAGASFLAALPLLVLASSSSCCRSGSCCLRDRDSCGGRPLAICAAALWARRRSSASRSSSTATTRSTSTGPAAALGLTDVGDFPSTVAVLVSAALLLKGVDHRSHELVLLSSLSAAFAIGIKPANLVFLAAPFLLLALARRWTGLALFAAGLVPAS